MVAVEDLVEWWVYCQNLPYRFACIWLFHIIWDCRLAMPWSPHAIRRWYGIVFAVPKVERTGRVIPLIRDEHMNRYLFQLGIALPEAISLTSDNGQNGWIRRGRKWYGGRPNRQFLKVWAQWEMLKLMQQHTGRSSVEREARTSSSSLECWEGGLLIDSKSDSSCSLSSFCFCSPITAWSNFSCDAFKWSSSSPWRI